MLPSAGRQPDGAKWCLGWLLPYGPPGATQGVVNSQIGRFECLFWPVVL